MIISSRTPEGTPSQCPVCGKTLWIDPSSSTLDATCPACGSLIWFPFVFTGSEVDLPHCGAVHALHSTTKQNAILEIVSVLVCNGHIHAKCGTDVFNKILEREQLGSTGIGNGFAVPHAKHASVDRLTMAMAVSEHGVEFDSLDGKLVHTLYLLISPTHRPGDHLRALERISRYIGSQTS